eukprot:gene3333-8261_t
MRKATQLQNSPSSKKAKFDDGSDSNQGLDSSIEAFFEDMHENLRLIHQRAAKFHSEESSADDTELKKYLRSFTTKMTATKVLSRQVACQVMESARNVKQAKDEMESTHLQLQNVLYELLHILHETEKCRSFRSSAENLELLDVKDMATSDEDKCEDLDPHLMMLKKLEMEALERARLVAELEERYARKTAIANINEKKHTQLRNLPDIPSALLDASKKAATAFSQTSLRYDERISEFYSENPLAKALPEPLHTLVMSIVGYNIAYEGKSWRISITGDSDGVSEFNERVDECRSFLDSLSRADLLENESFDTSFDQDESLAAENDNGDDDEEKRDRFFDTKATQLDTSEKSIDLLKSKMFAPHPLTVEIQSSSDLAQAFVITFKWYPLLSVVTAKENNQKTKFPILDHLNPGGQDTIFSTNGYLSSKRTSVLACIPSPVVSITERLGFDNIHQRLYGNLYAYIQHIAGLDEACFYDQELSHELHEGRTNFMSRRDCFETRKRFDVPGSLHPFPVELSAIAIIPTSYPLQGAKFEVTFLQSPTAIVNAPVSAKAMSRETSRYDDLQQYSARIFAFQIRRLQMCFDLLMELDTCVLENRPSQWCQQIYNGTERALPFRWSPKKAKFISKY